MQSNQLADTSDVIKDFKEALIDMKKDLSKNGWIFPQLEANMRNQINISNIKVEKAYRMSNNSAYRMQSSITQLKSGTNIVGELPILLKIKDRRNWRKKKDQILKHCIQEIDKKNKKNVVVLHDDDYDFKDVGKDLKRLLTDKTVFEYPSSQDPLLRQLVGKRKDISKLKDFIEKDNHVLCTRRDYFNGCESSNIIFLSSKYDGHRNGMMRGVENVIMVQVADSAIISGMKEDLRFY